MTDAQTNESNFNWPTDPPQDWFEAKGAALGLSPETIRFAAALHSLGGADAKKNTQAARLAGLGWDRVQAFRQARSVSVRKLLDEAKRLKAGTLPALTEADIDREIDDLIRTPDALTKARGIELREKRKDRQRQQGETPDDDGFSDWRACRDFLLQPNGAVAYLLMHIDKQLMGNVGNLPLLHDVHSLLMHQLFGPELWERCRARLNDDARKYLDDRLADPNWQKEARIKIWKEIGVDLSKVIKAA